MNFELHAVQLLPYDEIPETIRRIYHQYDVYLALGGKEEIPQDIIDAANAEIEGFFARQG